MASTLKYQEITKPLPYTTVELIGNYEWQLLLHIDNRNNQSQINRTVTFKTSISVNYYDLIKFLKDNSSYAKSSSFKFEVIRAHVRGMLDSTVKKMLEKVIKIQHEQILETTRTYQHQIPPDTELTLYQLIFSAPGISYKTDKISTSRYPLETVIISCHLRAIQFLKGVKVVCTPDLKKCPENALVDQNGVKQNINLGHDGGCIWLVPVWTTTPEEGVTSVGVLIQENENPDEEAFGKSWDPKTVVHSEVEAVTVDRFSMELKIPKVWTAKTSVQQFRYLKMMKDSSSTKKISRVGLFTANSSNDIPSSRYGWEWWTGNLNEGRNGGETYIYFCWNTIDIK